ncbi:hypothetical protein EJ08DRAFT_671571 [Tothia fuscella]|uniref:Uncharacterized protein n=1 Tax=Tothia fuscella TaxID=1048955 RepID=A0A9P4NLZ4_9PEZI|nr:hypothetical protein EJ08DRAFT_671571 [Tothia fuscella]
MALTLKALNNDTSFLLTFYPSIVPKDVKSPESFPGAYTILIDPWLSGPAEILGPRFSSQEHAGDSCFKSLRELPEPDMILISQDKPDHCHQETLCELSPHVNSLILAPLKAVKKIKSWRHFDYNLVHTLRRYSSKHDTIFRIEIPAFSSAGSPGEVTISLLAPKNDIIGTHNAIGITYRPPCSVLSMNLGSYLIIPQSEPPSPDSMDRPQTPRIISATANTIYPSPYNTREKTISLLYSPHGLPYSIIKPWASTHLVSEAALPLTALIHSFVQVDMPFYMGGNMATGVPGGLDIAQNLFPRVWVGAHDEEKLVKGVVSGSIQRKEFDIDDARKSLGARSGLKKGLEWNTEMIVLEAGEERRIDGR